MWKPGIFQPTVAQKTGQMNVTSRRLYDIIVNMTPGIWLATKLVHSQKGYCFIPMQIQPNQPLDEGSIACILRDLLHAVEYLHNEGKIHRDIKGTLLGNIPFCLLNMV